MKDVEMATRKPSGPYQDLEEPTEYRPVNWKKFFLTPKYIPWHILWIAITILTILITMYHDKVIEILRPFSEKVRDVPAGWLIPIVILIVISFPPLFGHEIIGLLCGVVYGLWIGFAIVAAGTFLGEVGTWFAFKKALRNKAIKLERTNLNYAALARVTREGGFWMVFIIRFSIVPSHFSTAVFSTCDVKFWHFAIATFLTLPKQIFIVYLGVLLVAADDNNKIQSIVLGITFVITMVMGVYIWMKMKKAKVALLEEQEARKASYDSSRFRQDSVSSSYSKPDLQDSDSEGRAPSNNKNNNNMWENPSDLRQDMPLGYTPYSQQEVGVALGFPAESRPAEYPQVPYNSTSTGQPSTTPWRVEQKPYYHQTQAPGQPQTDREWV